MADLHVLFPAQPKHREDVVAHRSEEVLVPDVGPVFHAGPDAASVFRTSIRHALLSRRLLFGIMALSVVLPLMGLSGWKGGAALTGVVVPIFAFLAAIDGEGRTERFWVGMGGPPGVRALARVLLDQLVIHGLYGLAVLCVNDETLQWTLTLAWLITSSLYGLTGLTRSVASTTRGRLGVWVLMFLSVALLGVLPHLYIAWIPIFEMLFLQGLALSILGVTARVLMSGRWSAAGAARRRWSPAWLVAPVLFLLPLPYVATVPVYGDIEWHASSSGTDGVGVPSDGLLGSAYLLWGEAGGSVERLPVHGYFPSRVLAHRSGAVTYLRLDWHHLLEAKNADLSTDRPSPHRDFSALEDRFGSDLQFGLVTADRSVIECILPNLTRLVWFDADGQGLTTVARDGALWRVDRDGCRPTNDEPSGLPEELVGYSDRLSATDDWRVVRHHSGKLIHLLEE